MARESDMPSPTDANLTIHRPVDPSPDPTSETACVPPIAPQPRTLSSEALLAGAKEVLIVHRDQVYRLRCTRNGRLILCK